MKHGPVAPLGREPTLRIPNYAGAAKAAPAARGGAGPDIAPVGACVGMKGSRVQNVVQELRGEKIDIIPWHTDAARFVCNALAPAEISRVVIDEADKSMEVIVPDEFLSVAIGKRGQNVRLASKLAGWHLDVKSETRYSEAMKSGYDSLVKLPGVGISLADALYEQGFYSAEELGSATKEDLAQVRGVSEDRAEELILLAQEAVERADEEAREMEEADADDAVSDGEAEAPAETDAEPGDQEAVSEEADAESDAREEAPEAAVEGSGESEEAASEAESVPEDTEKQQDV